MERKTNAALLAAYRATHGLAQDAPLYTLHQWSRHGRRVIPHTPANHHVMLWRRSGRCYYLADVSLYSIDKTIPILCER
nr:MAG TPA: hypothetical protein [Caudoviricetes sp.]